MIPVPRFIIYSIKSLPKKPKKKRMCYKAGVIIWYLCFLVKCMKQRRL